MSAAGMIFVLTPTVGWAIPLLWPALLSAAGALGYKLYTSTEADAPLRGELTREMESLKIARLSLDSVIKDIVSEEVGREQVFRFAKDDIVLVFKRTVRGEFVVEVMGSDKYTTAELHRMGYEFASSVVQQFAFNKMAAEMERRGAHVVEEEVNENGDIVLRLRKWD